MSKKVNKYAAKAQRQAMAGITNVKHEQAKNDLKKTALITAKDIVIGGLGGSLAGAVVGRSSLLLGILVTAGGHYFGSQTTAIFGVGMMASGGYQSMNSAMNGNDKKGIDAVKERLSNFSEVIKRQFYLDKLPIKKFKSSNTDDGTNGVGSVQYFRHRNDEDDLSGDLDFSEANRIESQLENMANNYAQKTGLSGSLGDAGTNGLDGEVSERLL